MGTNNWKSEGGSGGKRGHSNMDQWLYNDEMKDISRTARRIQAKLQINEAQRFSGEFWSVWRQDDNRQKHEIHRDLPLAEAQNFVAKLEAKGHKEIYWLERTC